MLSLLKNLVVPLQMHIMMPQIGWLWAKPIIICTVLFHWAAEVILFVCGVFMHVTPRRPARFCLQAYCLYMRLAGIIINPHLPRVADQQPTVWLILGRFIRQASCLLVQADDSVFLAMCVLGGIASILAGACASLYKCVRVRLAGSFLQDDATFAQHRCGC